VAKGLFEPAGSIAGALLGFAIGIRPASATISLAHAVIDPASAAISLAHAAIDPASAAIS
jgi:hypothetical protein